MVQESGYSVTARYEVCDAVVASERIFYIYVFFKPGQPTAHNSDYGIIISTGYNYVRKIA